MSFKDSLAGDWGTTRVQGKTVAGRQVVAWAGIAFWLLLMLVNTGEGGIVALWTALEFMFVMVLLASATRTVGLRQLLWAFLMGGFMMGIAYVGGNLLPPGTLLKVILVPPMEETLKIIPVVWILWRGRESRIWSLGVTDIMLLAAASGTGFGMVEDAYIRHLRGWGGGSLDWLPLTEVSGGYVIMGHAIWTTLAGITLGLALLLWNRAKWASPLAVAGMAFSALDHLANNYGVSDSGLFASFLRAITAHGYFALTFFLAGVVIVILFDLFVIHAQLPDLPELKLPKLQSGVDGLKKQWAFLVERRALAYVLFRQRGTSNLARANLVRLGTVLDQSLKRRHSNQVSASHNA